MKNNKKQQKANKKTNRDMAMVTYIFFVLFFVLIGYLVYFIMGNTENLLNNTRNRRQDLMAERVTKGSILSAQGKVLAETKTDKNGKEHRYYPYDELFAPVVGRVKHEKTGLEKDMSYTMLTSNINPLAGAANEVRGVKNPGNNVVTTLNVKLSKTAYEGLSGQKGAVVALDPETGKILAMVSTPSYNPNTVDEHWESLRKSDDAKLINRATQGLYPPGSTFKLVTALEYIRENSKYKKFSYTCKGKIGEAPDILRCYGGKVHGTLDLESAFAKSCNTSFAQIGSKLDIPSWTSLCNTLYFGKTVPLKYAEQKSAIFDLRPGAALATVRQTAIGQGNTLVTPLQNALLVSAIENKGVLMQPYLVDHVEDTEGTVVNRTEPKTLGTLTTKKEASTLRGFMKKTVQYGTATALASSSFVAGGKTGSAEFKLGSSDSHSWFVGFVEKNGKKMVVSIIVEGAGTGSEYAVPIARKMFDCFE